MSPSQAGTLPRDGAGLGHLGVKIGVRFFMSSTTLPYTWYLVPMICRYGVRSVQLWGWWHVDDRVLCGSGYNFRCVVDVATFHRGCSDRYQ